VLLLNLSPRALEDLERLREFLAKEDPVGADATADLIIGAVEVLTRHPLIGRPAEDNLRELLISRGRSGYIALYDYSPDTNRVVIRAVRHQREAGFEE
jgi:plasmid stabilization system protein ParE